MMSNTKVCHKCKIDKSVVNFSQSKHHATGYRPICKQCRSEHRTAIQPARKHYAKLLEEQNDCCAICGKTEAENKQKLSIDHNHTTNKIRALLCRACNTGLGSFGDSTTLLSIAIEYLEKHDGIA
jgi:hypothetical protein